MGRQAGDQAHGEGRSAPEARAESGAAGPLREPRAGELMPVLSAGLEVAEGQSRRDRSEAEPEGGRLAAGQDSQLSPHEPLPGKWEEFVEALAEGCKPTEAALRAGLGPVKANELLKRQETAQRVVFLVRQKVRNESGRAMEVISSLLAARSERVRLDSALAILDRSGVTEASDAVSPVTVVIDLSGR